jgi:hypothetical protein
MAMTIRQALNFRMPCGKAIKDMTDEDWVRETERVVAEKETVDEIEARGATSEENQWMRPMR